MKINSRLNGRGIKAVMILFLLVTGLYSCAVAQDASDNTDHHPINLAKTSLQDINHVDNINHEAQAVALNSSINSPYEDLKPALTPCGKRLYFSRPFHPDNTAGENDPEDIWYSDFDKETNTWSNPAAMTGALNNVGPNFINNVSVTGDTLILSNQYLKKGKMRAGLSFSAPERSVV